jgi:cholinesterase
MQIFPALALLLLSITTGTKAAASGPTTVVDLGYAQYEGSLNNETGDIEFLGVRYAASPTGRFFSDVDLQQY